MDSKELIDKIIKVSDKIAKESRQGAANYFIGNGRLSDMVRDYEKRETRKKKIKKLISNINERAKNN